MTPAAFVAQYPEYRKLESPFVQAKLAEAAALMGGPDTSVWGSFAAADTYGRQATLNLADVAHGALAADLLLTSPFGASLGLKSTGDGPSVYRKKYVECLEAVANGPLVAGVGGGPSFPAAAPPPALAFVAGIGTADVTNGSTAVTFSLAVSLPAGCLLAFASQPGAYYSLALPITAGTSGTLAAPYTGVTNVATTWVHT